MIVAYKTRYIYTYNIINYVKGTKAVASFPGSPPLRAIIATASGFRAALDLDTYPLSKLIRPLCAERTKPDRGKPVLIMHIIWLFRSPERSRFSEIATFSFHALVALKLLVSLISHPVACSPRIVVEKQTDRQTQTKYYNPRCACAPRVNKLYIKKV